MKHSNPPAPLRRLFTAACTLGLGAIAGCSTMSEWGAKTANAVSGAGATVRDSVAGAPPAVAAPAGRRANETAPPRQPAATAPASAVGLGGPTAAPAPVPAPAQVAAAPTPAPAPPPPAAAVPVPVPVPAPAPAARPVPVPAPAPALAPAPAPTTAPRGAAAQVPAPVPTPRPAPAAPAVTPVPAPAPRPVAAPAPAKPAAVTPSAVRPVTPGNYTVQVAAFAVAANAETTRDRVNARLAAAGEQLPPSDRTAQVMRVGDRSFVVVGDSPSRQGAEDLAKRLRSVLNQDVAVIRM